MKWRLLNYKHQGKWADCILLDSISEGSIGCCANPKYKNVLQVYEDETDKINYIESLIELHGYKFERVSDDLKYKPKPKDNKKKKVR